MVRQQKARTFSLLPPPIGDDFWRSNGLEFDGANELCLQYVYLGKGPSSTNIATMMLTFVWPGTIIHLPRDQWLQRVRRCVPDVRSSKRPSDRTQYRGPGTHTPERTSWSRYGTVRIYTDDRLTQAGRAQELSNAYGTPRSGPRCRSWRIQGRVGVCCLQ